MSDLTQPSILQNYDAEVSGLIASSRAVSLREALEMFLGSTTHAMLVDDSLKLWHFSPLVVFDMWENEQATGDPRSSLYLRGDEIA